MFVNSLKYFYLIMIAFVFFLIIVWNVKFFKLETFNGILSIKAIAINSSIPFNGILTNTAFNFLPSFNLQTAQPKNVSIFCFVKTHPGNFKSRLSKSYNNCISHCTDYRFIYFKTFKEFGLKKESIWSYSHL